MIYTVTFSPSLDYVVHVPDFKEGCVSRTSEEHYYPGGKGVNVSIMLSRLGLQSRALGFSAGFTGCEIERMLCAQGCSPHFIRLPEGTSRINIKLMAEQESDINAQGPHIPQEAREKLMGELQTLGEGDILVLAGNIPFTLPKSVYEDILRLLGGRGILAVVDATGDLLLRVLPFRPFLIKPNHHELGELFGKKLQGEEEILCHARLLQEKGARHVLVSMAGDGAVLLCENGTVLRGLPPRGTLVRSTGAGDSMVAGFIAGYLKEKSLEEALYTGLAAGSATAFSPWLGSREEVARLLASLKKA